MLLHGVDEGAARHVGPHGASASATSRALCPRPPRRCSSCPLTGRRRSPSVTSSASPPLLYDYSGFPPSTYELQWPAPGSPDSAARRSGAPGRAPGIDARADGQRGFDHGVFVPLKVAYPDPRIPTVQLSLRAGLDPAEHLAIGRALAPLRDEGVLIVGSGMSYHNMRGLMDPGTRDVSGRFDDWFSERRAAEPRDATRRSPTGRSAPRRAQSHPREEHLLPLMVVAGAAGADRGKRVLRDEVMGAVVSAFRFE